MFTVGATARALSDLFTSAEPENITAPTQKSSTQPTTGELCLEKGIFKEMQENNAEMVNALVSGGAIDLEVASSRNWETEFRPLTYPQAEEIVQRLKKQGVLGQADNAEKWGTEHYLQRLHDAGRIIFDRNFLGEAAPRVYPPSMKDLALRRF